MPQILKNNVSGVLNGSITAAATSMTLVDASSFPDPGADYYLLTLVGLNSNGQEANWEIVKVTSKASNTLTMVRAQEGTTAQAWPSATSVQMRLTAGSVATADRLAELSNKADAYQAIAATTYDATGLLTSVTYGSGSKALYAYNDDSQLVTAQHTGTDGTTVIATVTYTYNADGTLAAATRS